VTITARCLSGGWKQAQSGHEAPASQFAPAEFPEVAQPSGVGQLGLSAGEDLRKPRLESRPPSAHPPVAARDQQGIIRCARSTTKPWRLPTATRRHVPAATTPTSRGMNFMVAWTTSSSRIRTNTWMMSARRALVGTRFRLALPGRVHAHRCCNRTSARAKLSASEPRATDCEPNAVVASGALRGVPRRSAACRVEC
jgi:hypothetical protein